MFTLSLCYESGRHGYTKDPTRAFEFLKAAAAQGFPQALYKLGLCYKYGNGGADIDKDESLRLLQAAAKNGNADAQYHMAIAHMNADGVEVNHAETRRLLAAAAEQGHVAACFHMGGYFSEGLGVKKDKAEAIRLFTVSAEQDHVLSMRALVILYNGLGDLEQGFKWLKKAALKKDVNSMDILAELHLSGTGGAEKDFRLVKMLSLEAAAKGSAAAEFRLGILYQEGKGVKVNERKAVQYFTQAAMKAHYGAHYKLGMAYYDGKGVDADLAKAVDLFKTSATHGNKDAMFMLGALYRDGEGVPADLKSSMHWLRLAVESKSIEAMNELGTIYMHGQGHVDIDEAQAFSLFQEAAVCGLSAAQYNLADCYLGGVGVEKNLPKALRWFKEAAVQGDADAQFKLAQMCKGTDDKEAIEWLTKAADNGHHAAQNHLACNMKDGLDVPVNKKGALKLFKSAAEKCRDAKFNLGVCYRDGEGTAVNLEEAARWFTEAAKEGDSDAQVILYDVFKDGKGVPVDRLAAVDWLMAAAETCLVKNGATATLGQFVDLEKDNDPIALHRMGLLFLRHGHTDIATKWFISAAEFHNYADSQFSLGLLAVSNSKRMESEAAYHRHRALKLFKAAAKQGHVRAASKVVALLAKDVHLCEGEEEKEKLAKKLDKYQQLLKALDQKEDHK